MAIQRIKRDDREKWLELRRKYIGGADAAAVCGLNEFQSPYSLWAEKTGKVPEFAGNLRTDFGAFVEDFIAKRFEQETGKKVRRNNYSLINTDYPWGICDLDREIIGESAILECKCVNELALKHYANGDYPSRFYVQCMHYLAITGYEKAYLAVLIGTGRDFKIFEIERDEDEIKSLMEAEKQFYEWMTSGEEPPANPADVDSIELVHPTSNGTSIELFGQQNVMRKYLELKSRIAALEKEADGIAALLKQDLADAEKGTDGQYIVTWANRTKTTFDKKAFQKDNPKIDLSPWEKTTNYRAFSVKKVEV
jgi:putative phage-type endonuclease